MTAGGWIGYRISATSLKGTAPISVAAVTPTPMAHVASSDSARLLARTPVTVPSPSVVAIDSPASYVDWGCEERKELSLSYQLPPGASFISANVLPAEIDKAKTFNLLPPVYDADSHTVRTTAIFNGLDKFLFNCAGGGHARVYLRVTYSNPPLG